MNVRELLTKFSFKADTHDLHKIEQNLEGLHHKLELLTTIEIVKGLFELAERFGHFGEELHLAAQAAGITVEEFQKLAFSASQSAISQDELSTSLRILSKHLNDARHGSAEAQKVFRQAGLDPRGFKTSEQALLALSDRFSHIKDPIQKAALAQELLGRNSTKMVGYLSQGSAAIKGQTEEAEELGIVLGEDQVQALIDVEHAMSKVFALFKAVAATIAANVAPIITKLTKEFIELFKANRELIESNIQNFLMDLAFDLGFVWAAIKYGIDLVKKFLTIFGLQDHVLGLTVKLVGLVSAILIIGKVLQWGVMLLEAFGTAMGFIRAAVSFLNPEILLLMFVVHELFALLNGEPTWLGQFWEWIKSFEIIKSAIQKVSDMWDSFAGKAGDLFSSLKGLFGMGDINHNVNSIGGAPAANSIASKTVGGNNYDINAPITINVPEGTNPKEVSTKVQEGIGEHFSRMMRETQRSTRTQQAW